MQYDVLIVGGGLVGASLAIALKESGLSILVLEANSSVNLQKETFDARSIALSDSSKTILETLGVWQHIAMLATPIETIHVSKQAQFGRTLLQANEHLKPAFGFMVEMSHLNQAFQPLLQTQKNVNYWENACLKELDDDGDKVNVFIDKEGEKKQVSASLVVAADGTFSSVRSMLGMASTQKNYHGAAIVANIGLRRSHQYQAYERFTKTGLIALLPMRKQRASLVWALDDLNAEEVFNLSDDAFLSELQQTFGYRLGRFLQVGKRAKFPLSLTHMPKRTSGNLVFVGNASQTLHPVAGQGFNLGLRDVAVLAEMLHTSKHVSEVTTLVEQYEQLREGDRNKLMKSTDALVNFFGMNDFLSRKLQCMGLLAIDSLPIFNQTIVQQAMGYSSLNSKLACQIPL